LQQSEAALVLSQPFAQHSQVQLVHSQAPSSQHPQHSVFALVMSHPSPQHLQVQVSHWQSPVSQHPQQSHLPQPTLLTPIAAGTKGTRERAAQRIRLFIESLHIERK
jgi:hypothetical protein